MRTYAQRLVSFVAELEKRFHCHPLGEYNHLVEVLEPEGDRYGWVALRRTKCIPTGDDRTVTIAFDSSNAIMWIAAADYRDPVCGISNVCDLIHAIRAILSRVEMFFNIVELSGDLVRMEVFADTDCLCAEKKNPVKVALVTANQKTGLITEFQPLI